MITPPPQLMTPEAKRRVLVGVVGAVLLVASFSAGRFSAPLKVETHEVEVEKVVWKDKLIEKIVTVEVKGKTETKTQYVDRVVTKEGEVREKIVTVTKEVEVEKKGSTTDTAITHEGEKVREVEKIVTVTLQPSWRLGVLVGASLRDPFVPIAGPLVLGVQGEHRIVGGISAGVWVNTVGAAGAVVSLEF